MFFRFFSIFFFSQAAAEEDIAAGNDGSAAPFGAYMANALDQIALIHAAGAPGFRLLLNPKPKPFLHPKP